MKKSSIIALVTLSSLVLGQVTSFADESTSPVDPTAGVTVTSSTPSVRQDTSTEAVTNYDNTQNTSTIASISPVDNTTTPGIAPTVPVNTTQPSSEETPGTTLPSTTDPKSEDTVLPTAPSSTGNPSENTEQASPEDKFQTPADQPSQTDPTVNGQTTTVTPNVNVPTNNANVSAQVAYEAGTSQVGTTSQVTGQVVQNVTSTSPVYTNTGYTIVSTSARQVVVANADGSTATVAPETVGATVNSDNTISITTNTGELKTLPHTGEKEATLMSASGVGLLALIGAYLFKKKTVKN